MDSSSINFGLIHDLRKSSRIWN